MWQSSSACRKLAYCGCYAVKEYLSAQRGQHFTGTNAEDVGPTGKRERIGGRGSMQLRGLRVAPPRVRIRLATWLGVGLAVVPGVLNLAGVVHVDVRLEVLLAVVAPP